MTVVCNIWMICLELNWFVYDPSWMLHLSEFVWVLRSSVSVVFNNFLLIDATDRSKIISDLKRFFIALSLYPLSFFANTPFKFVGLEKMYLDNGTTWSSWRVSSFSRCSTTSSNLPIQSCSLYSQFKKKYLKIDGD